MSEKLPATIGYAVVVHDHYDPEKVTSRRVKNLGWLLRNWRDVHYFEVSPWGGEGKNIDCTLKAVLSGRRYYATGFSSKDVLWEWLKRPVFYNVRLLWFGHQASVKRGPSEPPC